MLVIRIKWSSKEVQNFPNPFSSIITIKDRIFNGSQNPEMYKKSKIGKFFEFARMQ